MRRKFRPGVAAVCSLTGRPSRRPAASLGFNVMRLDDVPFRTVPKHSKQYRARLARMPMENLRGVLRGRVYRHRALASGRLKRHTHRQIQRILALYEHRFGTDGFAESMRMNITAPLPKRMWLPGGYAHWRIRITGQSTRTPAAPADLRR